MKVKHRAFTVRSSTPAVAVAFALPGAITQAQTIERMRMTDNDLTCQQIHNKAAQQMEKVIARASQPVSVAVPGAPAAGPMPMSACRLYVRWRSRRKVAWNT